MTVHDSFIIEIHSAPVQFSFGRHEKHYLLMSVTFLLYYLDACYEEDIYISYVCMYLFVFETEIFVLSIRL